MNNKYHWIPVQNSLKYVKYIIIDWTKLFIYMYVYELAYMLGMNAELASLGSFDLIRNKYKNIAINSSQQKVTEVTKTKNYIILL